jgi:hypothetical protein
VQPSLVLDATEDQIADADGSLLGVVVVVVLDALEVAW